MKVEDAIGFARKAGRLAVGATAVERSVRHGAAKALLVTDDASERLRALAVRLAAMRGIPLAVWGTKDALGEALGRREVGIVAVCDDGFARSLMEGLSERR